MKHAIIKKQLPNQISLVLIPLSNTAAVTTLVLMGVGSRYESDAQQGLAHFTEHMVFKGGKKYPTAQAVAQSLDAIGGEFNAYTSQEFTGFYTKTASEHLELGIDVLADIVLHATFPETELEKEKGVIIEEINMYEDMPMRKVDHLLSRLAFGDTPLGRPILGTKQSVSAFTREDFLAYREQFYHGGKCTIVVAGAVDPEEATRLVETHFGAMPSGGSYRALSAEIIQTPNRVLLEEKASEQTHLMLATKGLNLKAPDRYAYRLLATILGGNMSSRLFTSVREQQGLCYYVRANPDVYVDTGLLVVSAGVDNARLDKAIAAIMRELALIREVPVPPAEVERAKEFLLGKTLLSMEDSEQVAEFYGMQHLLEETTESLEEIEAQLRAVTPAQVQNVAQTLFADENLRLAVIGPSHDQAKLDRLLTFNS